jgi:hypothetical protein
VESSIQIKEAAKLLALIHSIDNFPCVLLVEWVDKMSTAEQKPASGAEENQAS